MPRRLDHEALAARLLDALRTRGVSSAHALMGELGVSQATLSRLLALHRRSVIVIGRGRATTYAALRTIPDVGASVTLYEVAPSGRARRAAVLHAIHPRGFFVESTDATLQGRAFDDLPYFLDTLRPAGFLGCLIPERHPELELPQDVRLWSSDHCLRYLTRFGWDMPGSYIVGDRALSLFVERVRSVPDAVSVRDRRVRFPALASDVLTGAPGSSAAGEQPKFLATLVPSGVRVMVKFSPPTGDAAARRWGDLLVTEHLAHRTLSRHGVPSCTSEILEAGGRVFLQIERFDRTPEGGRRSFTPLLALDSEFVGGLRSWTATARALESEGRIDAAVVERLRWLELFGQLIGNSDMHFANVSLFARGEELTGLTPVYDMLPMFYAPQSGNVPEGLHVLPTPSPAHVGVWSGALAAARDFWSAVARDGRISRGFRPIAAASLKALAAWEKAASRLPT